MSEEKNVTPKGRPKKVYYISHSKMIEFLLLVGRRYGRPELNGMPFQLAEELQVPEKYIINWANRLRRLGVDIPKMHSAYEIAAKTLTEEAEKDKVGEKGTQGVSG